MTLSMQIETAKKTLTEITPENPLRFEIQKRKYELEKLLENEKRN